MHDHPLAFANENGGAARRRHPLIPRPASEVVADADLQPPYRRAYVDEVIGIERAEAGARAWHDGGSAVNHVAALRIDTEGGCRSRGETCQILPPGKIAPMLQVPRIVEQVE